MLKKIWFTVSIFCFCGISSLVQAQQCQKPIQVVASFSVWTDVVQQVGGSAVDVYSLVAIDADMHGYTPSTKDVRRVQKAQVVVSNGLLLEPWMDRLLESANFSGEHLVLAELIDPIPFQDKHRDHGHHEEHAHHDDHNDHAHHDEHDDEHDDEHHKDHGHHDDHAHHDEQGHQEGHVNEHHGQEHAHQEEHEGHEHQGHEGEDHSHHDEQGQHEEGEHGDEHHIHDHGEWDPHFWLDAELVRKTIPAIEEALLKQLPSNCSTEKQQIQQSANHYRQQLQQLDEWVHQQWKAIGLENRKVVVPHHAYSYYQNAYGVTFLAPGGLSTAEEISAKVYAERLEGLRQGQVKAVFLERAVNPRMMKQLAKDLNLSIVGTLSPGALGPKGSERSSYLELIKFNTRVLTEGIFKAGKK